MPPRRRRKAGVGVGVVGLSARRQGMKGSTSNRTNFVICNDTEREDVTERTLQRVVILECNGQ